jgi:hypothetical protein
VERGYKALQSYIDAETGTAEGGLTMPDIEDLIRQLREYVGPFTAMKLMAEAADVIEGQDERIAILEAELDD